LAPIQPGDSTRSISDLQAAELLIQAGKLAEAKRVLTYLQQLRPRDSQVLFLLGMIAVQQKDYPAAVRLFRRILVREPDAVRVRLELGRAFFLDKDYDNAERQFRLALAGKLPAAVKLNIANYLYAIRKARAWSYNLAVSAAPDTDINAGPSIQTVNIFGLPFQLSEQARKQSGVGVEVDGGGEWSPQISDDLRLRLGAQLHTADYGQGEFDDTTASTYAGLRLVNGQWDISPLATYYRRWYGGLFYNQGSGGSLQTTYYATQRLSLNGVVSAQYIEFGPPAGQSGAAVSAIAGAAYTLTSTSVVSAQAAVARQWAGLPAFANTAVQLQLAYAQDLPYGYSVSFQPSWVRIGYDAPLAAFGVSRVDQQWTLQATLLNRRIDVAGFTPRLLYAYTHNTSNIPLFAYDRSRLEVGFTRIF
jgi:hypothetical protein